jgi:hypothetical protein
MKEGDTLFEAGIGKLGHGLEEFCQRHEPDWLPLDADGWLNVGPYKTIRAAERGLKDFEEDFLEFLQEKFPGLEFKNAPDPRSLN